MPPSPPSSVTRSFPPPSPCPALALAPIPAFAPPLVWVYFISFHYVWFRFVVVFCFFVCALVLGVFFFVPQGMSVALGVTRVLQYVLQGLFHPARRVREVYWKLYNSLYILGADALTPAYPRLLDDGNNTFRRTHLELFV